MLELKEYYGPCIPVDDQKIWNVVVLNDLECQKRLKELKITDFITFQSYYEEAKYQKARRTFPQNRHKKG